MFAMKKVLEFIGALLVINGGAGIVHEFTGWFSEWTIVTQFPALDGYEIFGNIVVIVVGIAMIAFANVGTSSRLGS